MTLKEMLLQVYSEEEISELKLKKGITLDMPVENNIIEHHDVWDKIACEYIGHEWEVIYKINDSGIQQCKTCFKYSSI